MSHLSSRFLSRVSAFTSMSSSTMLRWICCVLVCLGVSAVRVSAQTSLGVTLTSSLVATQGETILYTLVITNRSASSISNILLTDVLDPNTVLLPGSLSSTPVAIPDAYPVLGNVPISVPAPGILGNDLDVDRVGPVLTVVPSSLTGPSGGKLALSANGSFAYTPPTGFEGVETFTYTLNDGEGFTDGGTVSFRVSGMIWFVNAAASAGGDGRFNAPFNSLAAFNSVNNGAGNNPAPGDVVFMYAGNYAGPVTLLNNQRLIGQGATESFALSTGLTAPAGSVVLPFTGGSRPTITGTQGGVTLAQGNVIKGIELATAGGIALNGSNVGALSILDVNVGNSLGQAVRLLNGNLDVQLGKVNSIGGINGILLANTTGRFVVTGDGAALANGSGGTIQGTSGDGVRLENVVNVSLSRMTFSNCQRNGLYGAGLNGLILDWCNVINNGTVPDSGGIRLGEPSVANGLVGSVKAGTNPTRISNTTIRSSWERNLALFNSNGLLEQLELNNVSLLDTRLHPLGAEGFYFEARGNAQATVSVVGCNFANNFAQGLGAVAADKSVVNFKVASCGFTNNNEGVVMVNAHEARLLVEISGNSFHNTLSNGAAGAAIAAVNASSVTPTSLLAARILNNVINGGGVDNHLITSVLSGAGQSSLLIRGNQIDSSVSEFSGIYVQAGEIGSGALNASLTLQTNSVKLGSLGSHGIAVQSRVSSVLCADLSGNKSITGGVGLNGINVRQRDGATFRLPGYAGALNSIPDVTSFLQARNAGTSVGASLVLGYTGGAACPEPLLAPLASILPNPSVNSRGVASASPLPPRSTAVFINESRADSEPSELMEGDLDRIVSAAKQRWMGVGLSDTQKAVLEGLRFEISDLPPWHLGASTPTRVQLDRRACGYGWFIDRTPMEDAEFKQSVSDHSWRLPGSGRIDLLTAVIHEMGHALGFEDDYSSTARLEVMYGVLQPGERRVPNSRTLDLSARQESPTGHFLVVPVTIGTLPPGKSVTLTFRATIAKPLPAGVCLISNQATVTADGQAKLTSDDPRTPELNDPTVTRVPGPVVIATLPASDTSGTSARLNGSLNPGATNAVYYFQYGPSASYGFRTPATGLPLGGVSVPISAVVNGLTPDSVYHFRAVGSNVFGLQVGSDSSFVTPIDVLVQPTNSVSCVGGGVSFVVVANPSKVNYQWQRRAADSVKWVNIAGATTASYATGPLTAGDDGAAYRVLMTGASAKTLSAEAVVSVLGLASPTVTYDFNRGLPPGTAIYGDASVVNGVLELNPNTLAKTGTFLTTDLAPGQLVRGFTAAFRVRMSLGAGSFAYADGFSFNWATDLPNGVYNEAAEEGEGSGLRICFDTYDNGNFEAPAIDVKWGTNVIGHFLTSNDFLPGLPDEFKDVRIRLNPGGTLDLTYRCTPIFVGLPIPGYTPLMTARFGLGSRTGGAFETHSIDDLSLQLVVDPTNGVPRIRSIESRPDSVIALAGSGDPDQVLALEDSKDLVQWQWLASVQVNGQGGWEFLDPLNANTPHDFFRLRAAPQFPAGLMDWWSAENSAQDSFGPLTGAMQSGAGFVPGLRGRAFGFDGVLGAVGLSGAPIPPPWTACFWVKRDDATDASAALISDDASALKLEQWPSSRQVGFTQFGVADYSFGFVLPTNVWTHLTFVGTPAGTVLYSNAIQVASNPSVVNLPRGVIGSRSTGQDHVKGSLDEITLFGRALTVEEIRKVINATRGP